MLHFQKFPVEFNFTYKNKQKSNNFHENVFVYLINHEDATLAIKLKVCA